MEKVFGLEIPENLEDACELNRTALLVYDMQVGIFSQLSNGDEIKSRVVEQKLASNQPFVTLPILGIYLWWLLMPVAQGMKKLVNERSPV